MRPQTVLFVCVHNAGRSQMAEAFTNRLSADRGLKVVGLSAGTVGGNQLNQLAVQVMAEEGISMEGQEPKLITDALVKRADRVISMGCGVDVGACPARFILTEDWDLADPAGRPVESVRAIRDAIKAKVSRLLDELGENVIRRYLAELIGTFVIVFAPVALSATSGFDRGAPGLLPAALVSGLSVLAMVYTFGSISAAHFNPAVTLAFAAARRFPWRFVVPYWAAQFLGGVLAAGLVALLFGPGHGAHVPAAGPVLRNVTLEAILGFLLMLVIIAVATDRRVSSTTPALAIGLIVVVCVLIGGPVTGGSMNPARSFGPAWFAGGAAWSNVWLYLVAPPIGAVLAALSYEAVRLEHGEAKGAPNELLEALQALQEAG